MAKRTGAVFTAFIFFISLVCYRIVDIGRSDYSRAASINNTASVPIATRRGTIYDCNMAPIVNNAKENIAAILPTPLALNSLRENISQAEFEEVLPRLQKGYPISINIGDKIIENDDIQILSVDKRYSSSALASHIVGYLDKGQVTGLSGIEKAYDEWLKKGSGKLSVTYNVDAYGRALTGVKGTINDENYFSKLGVQLSIDSNIQFIAEQTAKEYVDTGAIIIMDAKSRELKAVSSFPEFDPQNILPYLNADKSPMINRAFNSYTVGSIFKLVCAAAALESDITEEFTYACDGSIQAGNNIFNCANSKAHGWIDMNQAVEKSCNCYFVALAQVLKADKIIEMAKKLGFGENCELAPGLFSEKGNLPEAKDIDSKAALANLSFGQGDLLATPLQITNMMATLVTDGNLKTPILVKNLIDSNGDPIEDESTKQYSTSAISMKSVNMLKNMLASAVETGTAQKAKPQYLSAGAKTATAQTGWFENGEEKLHAWICGYYPADEPEYIITIIKEEGASGGTDCGPIFKYICDSLYSCEYIQKK